ncbi:MAG: hypothetical protein ACI9SP_004704 [Arenicella sp.]|jgi:hypothetical protein
MQRFFDSFSIINLFTLSLDHHQNKTQCAHCLKNNQFISHGIIYKQTSIAERKPVGKRIICSNRYGRSGCGRTVQLYVSNRIPRFCLFVIDYFSKTRKLPNFLTESLNISGLIAIGLVILPT